MHVCARVCVCAGEPVGWCVYVGVCVFMYVCMCVLSLYMDRCTYVFYRPFVVSSVWLTQTGNTKH